MKTFLAVGVTLAALACAMPIGAARADSNSDSGERHSHWREARAALFDARLVGFKASLALNPDQEKNWPAFEGALREMAKSRMEGRHENGKSDDDERPSPIDNMRRMSDRLGKRSTELKQFADASEPLYASLDDKQKLVFSATLRDWARQSHHGRRHD